MSPRFFSGKKTHQNQEGHEHHHDKHEHHEKHEHQGQGQPHEDAKELEKEFAHDHLSRDTLVK